LKRKGGGIRVTFIAPHGEGVLSTSAQEKTIALAGKKGEKGGTLVREGNHHDISETPRQEKRKTGPEERRSL